MNCTALRLLLAADMAAIASSAHLGGSNGTAAAANAVAWGVAELAGFLSVGKVATVLWPPSQRHPAFVRACGSCSGAEERRSTLQTN